MDLPLEQVGKITSASLTSSVDFITWNMRDSSTLSHPSKGENCDKNRPKGVKSTRF